MLTLRFELHLLSHATRPTLREGFRVQGVKRVSAVEFRVQCVKVTDYQLRV